LSAECLFNRGSVALFICSLGGLPASQGCWLELEFLRGRTRRIFPHSRQASDLPRWGVVLLLVAMRRGVRGFGSVHRSSLGASLLSSRDVGRLWGPALLQPREAAQRHLTLTSSQPTVSTILRNQLSKASRTFPTILTSIRVSLLLLTTSKARITESTSPRSTLESAENQTLLLRARLFTERSRPLEIKANSVHNVSVQAIYETYRQKGIGKKQAKRSITVEKLGSTVRLHG
jgi:hypothetical protein